MRRPSAAVRQRDRRAAQQPHTCDAPGATHTAVNWECSKREGPPSREGSREIAERRTLRPRPGTWAPSAKTGQARTMLLLPPSQNSVAIAGATCTLYAYSDQRSWVMDVECHLEDTRRGRDRIYTRRLAQLLMAVGVLLMTYGHTPHMLVRAAALNPGQQALAHMAHALSQAPPPRGPTRRL